MTRNPWWMPNYKSMNPDQLREEIVRLFDKSATDQDSRINFLNAELALRGGMRSGIRHRGNVASLSGQHRKMD